MRRLCDWQLVAFVINISLAIFFCAFLVTETSTTAGKITPEVLSNSQVSEPVYTDELLENTAKLVNKTRASNNLNPLIQSPELDRIASVRATDMSVRGYYAHKSPDGKLFSDLLKENDVSYSFACENLNTMRKPSSASYVNSWLASPKGHKECMLKASHTQAGYAVATIETIGSIEVNQKVIVAIYTD